MNMSELDSFLERESEWLSLCALMVSTGNPLWGPPPSEVEAIASVRAASVFEPVGA